MTYKELARTLPSWVFAIGMLGASLSAQAVEITITCGPSGSDVEFCLKHAQAWAAKTGNTIQNFSPPNSPTEKLALYRPLFAAKSSDIDVVQIDTVWPGLLKDHLADLKPYSQGVEAQHFPAIIANNSVNGKLLGMPWYTDAGLLYYRTDLSEKIWFACASNLGRAYANRVESSNR